MYINIYRKYAEEYNMKEKKNLILIIVCVVLTIVLLLYGLLTGGADNPEDNYVSNALVARDVALLLHSEEECNNVKVNYFDKNVKGWYVPYMNLMYEKEYFSDSTILPNEKGATKEFTFNDLKELYINIGVEDDEVWSYVHNNRGGNKIKLSEWRDIFDCLVRKLDTNKTITKTNIVIVGTPGNVATMEKWTCATNIGFLKFTGLSVDYYIDKEVVAYVKNNQLLLIGSIESEEVSYDNSWVITCDGGNVKAYVNGVIREFKTGNRNESYSNVVADISLKEGKFDEIVVKKDAISGKVLSSASEGIEIENKGYYKMAKNVKIYKTFGALSMMSAKDILVGYDIGQYFVQNGEIVAVVLDRDVNADNIRVLVMNTGFKEIYHDQVVISSSTGLTIKAGDKTYNYKENEKVNITIDNEWLKSGRIKITPGGVNGKITVESIKRSQGAPSYRGDLELNIYDGRIVIINELPIEKYLLSVVPSEMPYTYNIEALKAQALCARSYAYMQILNNSYSRYGAHVDDSTSFQVYNNAEEKESTTQAVEETYGRVIAHKDEVITAFFFSTSCGATTDSRVWGDTILPYTSGKVLTNVDNNMDLSKEETFDAFIRVSYDTFEKEYPWYRWNVSLSLDEITNIVNANVSKISNVTSGMVHVLGADGVFAPAYVASVGNVKRIEVGARNVGGVLESITIYGSEKTIKVFKELNIRKLFNIEGYKLERLNGSTVTSFAMLPSAYAIFDPIISESRITGYNILGGGYGHGVGLSQNGANYMGKQGMNYEEIIKFFYKDVEVKKIY
jgi:stage II sporulation protein D